MPQAHSYGFLPGFRDRRDHKFGVARPAMALAPKIDLTPRCPPVFNQGGQNSCTANAVVAAIQFDRMKQGLPLQELSRRFVYWNTRRMEVTTDSDAGSMIRDAIKTCNITGVCEEQWCEYDDALIFEEPSLEAYDKAEEKAVLYDRLDDPKLGSASQLNLFKMCLASGTPFVLGIAIFDSFETDEVTRTGVAPMPADNEGLLGWHAVMCCGYDDADGWGRFTVQNSWGTEWGNKGRFTIPYSFLTTPDLAMDAWAIRTVL